MEASENGNVTKWPNNNNDCPDRDVKKHLETLIEHKCKQMGKSSYNGKCNAVHLEQWMKGQLDNADPVSPVIEQIAEVWTAEMLRKRSEELQLIDAKGHVTIACDPQRNDVACEEIIMSDHDEHSPSKSTTTESQVTVRSSPIVPEAVPVCRQCHKNCLSHVLANSKLEHHQDCTINQKNNNHLDQAPKPDDNNDWQAFLLLGMCANPVASLVKYDPFQQSTPNISVAPPTPPLPRNNPCQNCICPGNPNDSMESDLSPDNSPEVEEPPYHSLSSSVQTLRRYGTVSSLERCGSEDKVCENHCSSESDDDDLGIDNEAFNHSSIMSWTARAGSFVAEKMNFFEKLGEDYRSGGGFFDRYLKSPDVNGDDAQEEETSGATSGEEIWGTPTSGDMDEPRSPTSPNFEGKLSPNNDYTDNVDDTEIMMDELLMAPPITGAILRGLLPRRTLEPLIEEDFSDTTSSTSSSDPMSPQSGSSEQGNQSGSAADICFRDVVELAPNELVRNRPSSSASGSGRATSTSPDENEAHRSLPPSTSCCPTTISHSLSSEWEEAQRVCVDGCAEASASMPRSESYRKIVEAAEDAILEVAVGSSMKMDPGMLFDSFRPSARFVNIERVPRTRSIKIFEFFNVRRTERRIYERFPENRLNMFTKETDVADASTYSPTKSPKSSKDNRNGRFWRQLSRRRTLDKTSNAA